MRFFDCAVGEMNETANTVLSQNIDFGGKTNKEKEKWYKMKTSEIVYLSTDLPSTLK